MCFIDLHRFEFKFEFKLNAAMAMEAPGVDLVLCTYACIYIYMRVSCRREGVLVKVVSLNPVQSM